MVQYMKPVETDADKVRSKVPPPLIREGERVQPNWLYSFLLDPPPIRPHRVHDATHAEVQHERRRRARAGQLLQQRLAVDQSGRRRQRRLRQRAGARGQVLAHAHGRVSSSGSRRRKNTTSASRRWSRSGSDALKRRIAEAEAGLDAVKQAVKDAKVDQVKQQKEKDVKELEAQDQNLEERSRQGYSFARNGRRKAPTPATPISC